MLRSFAATLSSFDRRAGIIPSSWNAGSVPPLSDSSTGGCYANQVERLPMRFQATNVPELHEGQLVTVTGAPLELQVRDPLPFP